VGKKTRKSCWNVDHPVAKIKAVKNGKHAIRQIVTRQVDCFRFFISAEIAR